MRRCAIALLLAAALLPIPGASAAVPVVVLDGRGFGHGVGMAQDGAYWMGRAGATTPQILAHFYPGTTLGRAAGEVRVAVHTAPSGATVVSLPEGGEVRDGRSGTQSPGFPVAVGRGGRVRLRWDGARMHVEAEGAAASTAAPASSSAGSSIGAPPQGPAGPPAGPSTASGQQADPAPTSTTTSSTVLPPPTTSTTAAPATTSTTAGGSPTSTTTTTAAPRRPPSEPAASTTRTLWVVPAPGGTATVVDRGRRYRGVIEALPAGAALRLANEVDVEQYLRGMGEVRDPRWPSASLRTQAIAARTYAMRAMAAGGELCDDQRCQVYLGTTAEYAAMDRAVADTAGQVLRHGRGFASTVYSANGGGHSASREEGFGTTGDGYPYLRPAPYTTGDPLPWRVVASLADVARRTGYPGELTSVSVARTGPSGRALEVALDGSAGPRSMSGIAFDRALGLRSTMFTAKTTTAATAPPPLGRGALLQALPEEAAALAAAPPPPPPDPTEPKPPADPYEESLALLDRAGARRHGRPIHPSDAAAGDRPAGAAPVGPAVALLLAAAFATARFGLKRRTP